MADTAPPPNSLPVLVTAPGEYVTRAGHRVTIREVRDGSPGTTSFGATGAVWRERRGVSRPRGVDVWHVSGRHMVLRETDLDIVGPYVRS
jgi:hypothetical protein